MVQQNRERINDLTTQHIINNNDDDTGDDYHYIDHHILILYISLQLSIGNQTLPGRLVCKGTQQKSACIGPAFLFSFMEIRFHSLILLCEMHIL